MFALCERGRTVGNRDAIEFGSLLWRGRIWRRRQGRGSSNREINDIVEQIAVDIVKELKREHLTTSGETFLEWQRPYVEDHIASDDPVLKSL